MTISSKYEGVQKRVWSDLWFLALSAPEKLLWFYLLTSERTNYIGVFRISIPEVCQVCGFKNQRQTLVSIQRMVEQEKISFDARHCVVWIRNRFSAQQKCGVNLNENIKNHIKNELDFIRESFIFQEVMSAFPLLTEFVFVSKGNSIPLSNTKTKTKTITKTIDQYKSPPIPPIAAPVPAPDNKRALKRPRRHTDEELSIGTELYDYLVAKLSERNIPKLSGTFMQNRGAAIALWRKWDRDIDKVKQLIDMAMNDTFYCNVITSFPALAKNDATILAKAKDLRGRHIDATAIAAEIDRAIAAGEKVDFSAVNLGGRFG